MIKVMFFLSLLLTSCASQPIDTSYHASKPPMPACVWNGNCNHVASLGKDTQ